MEVSTQSPLLRRGVGLHSAVAEPTAAELLEASKRLYVKTDILKDTKLDPGHPRIFHSPREEEIKTKECSRRPRAIVFPMRPPPATRPQQRLQLSAHSAFRPVVKVSAPSSIAPVMSASCQSRLEAEDEEEESHLLAPVRPPKSTRIRQRARRLNDALSPSRRAHSPPPLPPPRQSGGGQSEMRLVNMHHPFVQRRPSMPAGTYSVDVRPVPAPRLSKMSTSTSPSSPYGGLPPPPPPRRRTIHIDGDSFFDLSKSTPNLAAATAFSPPPLLLQPPSQQSLLDPSGAISPPHSSHHSSSTTQHMRRRCPSSVRPATPLPEQHTARFFNAETPILSPSTVLHSPSKVHPNHVHHSNRPRLSIARSASARQQPSTVASAAKATVTLSPSCRRGGSLSLSSPTSKDSGVQPGSEDDDEDAARKFSSDDGYEDEAHHQHECMEREEAAEKEAEMEREEEERREEMEGEGSSSSHFTSITNQPRREDFESETDDVILPLANGRPLSVLERNARVIAWIRGNSCGNAEKNRPQQLQPAKQRIHSPQVFGESLNV